MTMSSTLASQETSSPRDAMLSNHALVLANCPIFVLHWGDFYSVGGVAHTHGWRAYVHNTWGCQRKCVIQT